MTSFEVGDRVAADNSELCGHCFYCRRGEPLLCENVRRLCLSDAMISDADSLPSGAAMERPCPVVSPSSAHTLSTRSSRSRT